MNICGKGCNKINFSYMLFTVEYRLIKMSRAPALGHIEIKKLAELLCRLTRYCVSPCSEFGKLLAVFIKRKIAVHHSADAESANR